jgi:hypothetical protein
VAEVLDRLKAGTLSFDHLERFSNSALKIHCLLQVRSSDNRANIHVSYLKKDTFGWVVQNLITAVLADPENRDFYVQGCRTIAHLLYCQPLETLTQNILQQCVAFATVPWMSGEVKLADLRLGDTLTHNLIGASHRLESVLDGEDAALALEITASLPKEVSPRWRINAFRKAWFGARNAGKRRLLVMLPVWAQALGQAGAPLAREIMNEALASNEKELMTQLAKNAGVLVCVQSRLASLCKRNGKIVVVCSRCDLKGGADAGMSSSEELPLHEVEHLLKLVGNPDQGVKLGILSIVEPLSNHVGLNAAVCGLFLNYIEDLTYDEANLQFSLKIKYLVAPGHLLDGAGANPESEHSRYPGWSEQEKVCERLVDSLQQTCTRPLTNQSTSYLDTVCRMVVSVGETGVSYIEKPVLSILLHLVFEPVSHVPVYCHTVDLFRALAAKHKSHTLTALSDRLIWCSDQGRGEPGMMHAVHMVMVMMEKNEVATKTFLQKQIHHLLPDLVVKTGLARKDQPSPVDFVAAQLDVRCRHLLGDNFQYIFPHLATQTTTEQYAKCVKYLSKETTMPMEQLLPGSRQHVVTELLLRFHTHGKRVQTAFQWLAMHDDDFKSKRKGAGRTIVKEDLVRSNLFIEA